MPAGFDLARKSKARAEVGVDAKTLESWGLTFFTMGGCIFFSKSELENLIRTKGKQIKKEVAQ
jgi:hypothetical protein